MYYLSITIFDRDSYKQFDYLLVIFEFVTQNKARKVNALLYYAIIYLPTLYTCGHCEYTPISSALHSHLYPVCKINNFVCKSFVHNIKKKKKCVSAVPIRKKLKSEQSQPDPSNEKTRATAIYQNECVDLRSCRKLRETRSAVGDKIFLVGGDTAAEVYRRLVSVRFDMDRTDRMSRNDCVN